MTRYVVALVALSTLCLDWSRAPMASGLAAGLERAREALDAGQREQALVLTREVVAAVEGSGGNHLGTLAHALDLQVEALLYLGRAHESSTRELAERAVEVNEAVHGSGAPALATSLSQLGSVLEQHQAMHAARAAYERALAVASADAEERPTYLANLVVFLLNRFDESAVVRARELELLARRRGDDAHLVRALSYQAEALEVGGDLSGATRLYELAAATAAERLGDMAARTIRSRRVLARHYQQIARYESALTLYERMLAPMSEDEQRGRASLFAALHHDLGALLIRMESYEDAERSLKLAVEVRLEGRSRRNLIRSTKLLAHVLHELGKETEARIAYADAVEQARAAGLATELASVLSGFGVAATEWGAEELARSTLDEALALRRQHLGEAHPAVARTLNNLGYLHLVQGRTGEARARLRDALVLLERSLPASHPEVTRVRNNYARAMFASADYEAALELNLAAVRDEEAGLRLRARSLPARAIANLDANLVRFRDTTCTVAAATGSPEHAFAALDSIVRTRAVLLDTLALRHRTFESTGTPELQSALDRVRDATKRYADGFVALAALQGLRLEAEAGTSLRETNARLERARLAKEEAERTLLEVGGDVFGVGGTPVGWADVAAALPSRSALVAYVHYVPWEPGPRTESRGARARYAAVVVDEPGGTPLFVDLGPAVDIAQAVERWRAKLEACSFEECGVDLEIGSRRAGAALRELVWDPVVPALSHDGLVFIVPDGMLNHVAFGVLPSGTDRYVQDDGRVLHYLSAERDIVRLGPEPRPPRSLFALGAIDYGRLHTAPGGPNEAPKRDDGGPHCGPPWTRRGWMPLRASDDEIAAIVDSWADPYEADPEGLLGDRRGVRVSSRTVTGGWASESEFKRIAPESEAIHIATHGYVWDPQCPWPPEGSGETGSYRDSPPGMLLRSGLVLAGANELLRTPDAEEDGILTAEEIAALDLTSVRWAVLSGCDTGLGGTGAGEGILGLRRAFEIAGAGTLIQSVWKVSDVVTASWMRELYANRILHGMSTAAAVHHANRTLLERRRAAGGSTHPFHWSGFVASGDWR